MSSNPHKVFQLLYKSAGIPTLTQKDVAEIVAHSNKHNNARGISGFLVFENGQFMQLLEGDEAVIKELYHNKIAKDSRHTEVKILKESHGPRMFAEWSMSRLPIGMFEKSLNIKAKKAP
jgi:hypothetical protein